MRVLQAPSPGAVAADHLPCRCLADTSISASDAASSKSMPPTLHTAESLEGGCVVRSVHHSYFRNLQGEGGGGGVGIGWKGGEIFFSTNHNSDCRNVATSEESNGKQVHTNLNCSAPPPQFRHLIYCKP